VPGVVDRAVVIGVSRLSAGALRGGYEYPDKPAF
jgi:hypothetical protein